MIFSCLQREPHVGGGASGRQLKMTAIHFTEGSSQAHSPLWGHLFFPSAVTYSLYTQHWGPRVELRNIVFISIPTWWVKNNYFLILYPQFYFITITVQYLFWMISLQSKISPKGKKKGRHLLKTVILYMVDMKMRHFH